MRTISTSMTRSRPSLPEKASTTTVCSGPRATAREATDYLNCPLSEEEYRRFRRALLEAEQIELREFERPLFFEGCLPIEELARRGEDTMRFGPMKPVGLRAPDGTRPPRRGPASPGRPRPQPVQPGRLPVPDDVARAAPRAPHPAGTRSRPLRPPRPGPIATPSSTPPSTSIAGTASPGDPTCGWPAR